MPKITMDIQMHTVSHPTWNQYEPIVAMFDGDKYALADALRAEVEEDMVREFGAGLRSDFSGWYDLSVSVEIDD